MALEGFDVLAGKWILLRNEGFDEYLSANGIGYIKRKIAGAVTNKMEIIKIGDNKVRIITKGPKYMDNEFTLDSESEEKDPFDNKVKVIVKWDLTLKVLRIDATPMEKSKAKKTIIERKLVDNEEMLMEEVTLPNEKPALVCRRYFKRES